MELTVKERLMLLTILPREGKLDTIKIVQKLRNDLSFSEEERTQLNLIQKDDGSYSWDEIDNIPILKKVEISEVSKKIIGDELNNLNIDGKVTEQHLGLFNKFEKDGE